MSQPNATPKPTPSRDCETLVRLCIANHTPEELALGWLRYEAVRKLNARQFAELCQRNLGGKSFDDLVTEAVLGFQAPRK